MDISFLMKCLQFPILVLKLECDSEIEEGVSPSQQHSFSFCHTLDKMMTSPRCSAGVIAHRSEPLPRRVRPRIWYQMLPFTKRRNNLHFCRKNTKLMKLTYPAFQNTGFQASKLAHQEKVLAVQAHGLSSIPEPMVKGEKQLLKCVLWPPHCVLWPPRCGRHFLLRWVKTHHSTAARIGQCVY